MKLFKVKWRLVNQDLWKRLAFGVVMFIVSIGILFGIIISSFMPPLTLSTEQILTMQGSSNEYQRYNIEVMSTLDMNTAYELTRWKGPIQTSSTTTYYGVLVIGDRLLMISSDQRIDETKTSYTGVFYNQLPDEVRSEINAYPEFQRQLLPVYFDEGYKLSTGEFFGAGIMVIVCFVVGFIGTRRVIAELPSSEDA